MDLERADTFTAEYLDMNRVEEEGILDEEHVNWSVLATRIFAFFLLFCVIVCIALQAITRRFLVLAAIICFVLIIVIISTYVDLRKWLYCWKNTDPNNRNAVPSSLSTPSPYLSNNSNLSRATTFSPTSASNSIKNPILRSS